MKRLLLATILFLFPFSAHAGFPEVENGYDLKKIEESFRLTCDEIGKDGLIRTNIKKEATYRINFWKEETKKTSPKLVKKLQEDVVLDEERIENLPACSHCII